MSQTRLLAAFERMKLTRRILKTFLDDFTEDEWYWTPAEFTTHVAWQVAHVACSQYDLCLVRSRGRLVSDEAFMPEAVLSRYRIGTTPVAGKENNPSVAELTRILDAVQDRCLSELAERTDEQLDVPLEKPHPLFSTVLAGIEFAPQHELIHYGQIALLRRLMGKAPLR